jgi:hypothetical protein
MYESRFSDSQTPTMSHDLEVESQRQDRTAADCIETDRPERNWRYTDKQGKIAQAALVDPQFPIGQIAEQADAHQHHVALVLEHATEQQLVDMVLALHGFDPKSRLEYAYDTGQWDMVDEMYENIYPAIMQEATA